MPANTIIPSPSSLTYSGVQITGFSALLGRLPSSGSEQPGKSFLYQDIAVPAGTTTLTFEYWPYTEDTIAFDWQECQIQTTGGGFLAQVFKVCANTQAWVPITLDLSPYAGQTIRLWFNCQGDGASDYTYYYLGAVSAINGSSNLIVNGDFAAGNLSGWTVGADGGGTFNPIISQGQVFGQPQPASQTVNVSMSDSSVESLSVSSDQAWLTASVSNLNTPGSMTVSANTLGLTPGVYNGNITLAAHCCIQSGSGAIATYGVHFGGNNYIAGEAFGVVVPGGLTPCTACATPLGIIDTVDGGGRVLTFHLTYLGDCLVVTTGSLQDTFTSGPGDGTFSIDIFSVTPNAGGCHTSIAIPVTLTVGGTTGNIVIQKATVPGGSSQAFLFNPSYTFPFTLLDGQSNDSGPLAPGTYSVVETPVTDWVTTVSSNPSVIMVSAGVTTTVTFTNTFSLPPPPPPCPEPTACPFTLADAQSALGLRLYDPTHQFWSLPELTAYIIEALRTWNALASYWRDEFTFPSAQGVVWYDITDTTVAPNTLRPLTVTDQELMEVMEYHLLEPITDTFPLTWTGSAQFSVADLQQALNRRRDEILSVTGCTITRLLLPAMPGKIPLPNRATELRRVAFIPADGFDMAASPMFQDDIWALQAFRPTFTTDAAGVPDTYVISTEPIRSSATGPTITFLPNVPPGVPGQFEVLVLESGTVLCPTGPTLVTIPDDWTWILKWGALADLLSRESNAKDNLRAKYCEARYKQGMSLLAVAPALLTMRWDNLPLQIDAVKAVDTFRPTWEGGVQDVPDAVVTAGMNLLGLAPPPTATGVTLTADVIRNAPIPMLDTDCIQVTRDVYDVLLDYVCHLAAWKQGGAEFEASIPLMQRFMEAAAISSSRLGEQGEFQKILWQRSQLEDALNPRYSEPTPEVGD